MRASGAFIAKLVTPRDNRCSSSPVRLLVVVAILTPSREVPIAHKVIKKKLFTFCTKILLQKWWGSEGCYEPRPKNVTLSGRRIGNIQTPSDCQSRSIKNNSLKIQGHFGDYPWRAGLFDEGPSTVLGPRNSKRGSSKVLGWSWDAWVREGTTLLQEESMQKEWLARCDERTWQSASEKSDQKVTNLRKTESDQTPFDRTRFAAPWGWIPPMWVVHVFLIADWSFGGLKFLLISMPACVSRSSLSLILGTKSAWEWQCSSERSRDESPDSLRGFIAHEKVEFLRQKGQKALQGPELRPEHYHGVSLPCFFLPLKTVTSLNKVH